jgi:hypothetical protein
MLQRISINYRGKSVTVEDMLKHATFLKKLKLPFVILVATDTVLYLVVAITMSISDSDAVVPELLIVVYNCVIAIFISLGFLVYGRRLVSLLPNQYCGKVKRLSFKLTILMVS